MADDQLSISDHVASVSQSCRFSLYNLQKVRPYPTQYATQLPVQAMVISSLHNTNAGLPGLQSTQDTCFIKPHWLPVAAWKH